MDYRKLLVNNQISIEDIPTIQWDEDLFNIALKKIKLSQDVTNLLNTAPNYLFNSKLIEQWLERKEISAFDVPSFFWNNKEIIEKMLEYDSGIFHEISHLWGDCEDIVLKAVKEDGLLLQYCSREMKRNMNVVVEACSENGFAFEFVDDTLKSSTHLAKCALGVLSWQNGNSTFNNKEKQKIIFDSFPEILKSDISFLNECIEADPKIFSLISSETRKNNLLIETACRKDSTNLQYCPPEYKEKKSFIKNLLIQNVSCLQYCKENIKDDIVFLFPILKKFPHAITYCGNKIKHNKKVALEVCAYNSTNALLQFFCEELKDNDEIASIAIRADARNWEHVSKRLKSDKSFFLSYLNSKEYSPDAISYLSNDLKSDPTIIINSFDKNFETIKYISDELKNDTLFIKNIYQKTIEKYSGNHLKLLIKNINFTHTHVSGLLALCETVLIYNKVEKENQEDFIFQSIVDPMSNKNHLKSVLINNPPLKTLRALVLEKKLSEELNTSNTDCVVKKIKI